MATGEEGLRPVSQAAALDDSIAEASAEHSAQDHLREGVLEERIGFVVRHRKRLIRDAERGIEQAKERYLEHVNGIEQSREELIGLNETRIWAALFPSETLASMAPSHALVCGRPRETEQHLPGSKAGLPAHAVLALLRADCEVLAGVSTREQAAAIRGITTAELTGDEAMWAGSDPDLARQAREKERLLAAGGSTTVDALKLLELQRSGLSPLGS